MSDGYQGGNGGDQRGDDPSGGFNSGSVKVKDDNAFYFNLKFSKEQVQEMLNLFHGFMEGGANGINMGVFLRPHDSGNFHVGRYFIKDYAPKPKKEGGGTWQPKQGRQTEQERVEGNAERYRKKQY